MLARQGELFRKLKGKNNAGRVVNTPLKILTPEAGVTSSHQAVGRINTQGRGDRYLLQGERGFLVNVNSRTKERGGRGETVFEGREINQSKRGKS